MWSPACPYKQNGFAGLSPSRDVTRILSRLRRNATETENDTDVAGNPPVDGTPASASAEQSSGGRLRKVLLGLGVLGAGAVAARRFRKGSTPQSADELRDTVEEKLPTGSETKPEGDETDVETGAAAGVDAGTEPVETGDVTGTDATATETAVESEAESMTGAESTVGSDAASPDADESLAGETVDDAHEEPAEPGEMMVEDDVVEEASDTDESSTEDERE